MSTPTNPCSWRPIAGGHTCGARIYFEMDERGLAEKDACALVAMEWPVQCGNCLPEESCYSQKWLLQPCTAKPLCVPNGGNPCYEGKWGKPPRPDDDKFGGLYTHRCPETLPDQGGGAPCCSSLSAQLVGSGSDTKWQCLPCVPEGGDPCDDRKWGKSCTGEDPSQIGKTVGGSCCPGLDAVVGSGRYQCQPSKKCPSDFPYPAQGPPANVGFVCYNSQADASQGSGDCDSWCTKNIAKGDGCPGDNSNRLCQF